MRDKTTYAVIEVQGGRSCGIYGTWLPSKQSAGLKITTNHSVLTKQNSRHVKARPLGHTLGGGCGQISLFPTSKEILY